MLIFGVLLVLFSVSFAVINLTGCGSLNTAGETYILLNNVTFSTVGGTCFTFGADNIIFEGSKIFIKLIIAEDK